jgi:hypothetical protein
MLRFLSLRTQAVRLPRAISGACSMLRSVASLVRSTRELTNAALILFPDSNHGSHFQFTQRFNRYVADFVDH